MSYEFVKNMDTQELQQRIKSTNKKEFKEALEAELATRKDVTEEAVYVEVERPTKPVEKSSEESGSDVAVDVEEAVSVSDDDVEEVAKPAPKKRTTRRKASSGE